MNIEQKINRLINQTNTPFRNSIVPTIDKWAWYGALMTWSKDLVDTLEEEKILHQSLGTQVSLEYQIMQLIKESNDLECLTSQVEYIRKTKEWFINESRKET